MDTGTVVATHLDSIRKSVASALARYTGAAKPWDIDDISGEVIVRLLDGGLAKYDPERGAIGAYISRCARNLAIDVLRGRKATVAIGERSEEDTSAVTPVDESLSPAERIAALDDYRAFKARIESLNAADRAEYEASERDGYSYESRAAELGVSVNAIKVRMSRVRKKIA